MNILLPNPRSQLRVLSEHFRHIDKYYEILM